MNLAGKTFRAISNSTNGTLNTETTMTFQAEDEAGIVGTYRGGAIRTGSVVARRKSPTAVEMLYHCITLTGELKAGRATARFVYGPDRQLHMHLDWQWLTGDRTKGTSDWALVEP